VNTFNRKCQTASTAEYRWFHWTPQTCYLWAWCA